MSDEETEVRTFIVEINRLARHCGCFNGETDVNNGYGCNHPECDEVEDGQGKCLAFSCPLSWRANKQDLLDAGFKDAETEDDDYLSLDLMVITEEQVKQLKITDKYLDEIKQEKAHFKKDGE